MKLHKVLTKRLTPKQSAQRTGRLQNKILQKWPFVQYHCKHIPLVLTFIDYQKGFDSVQFERVLEALDHSRIDCRCTSLIGNIYFYHLGGGVRQRSKIPPKLLQLL